ncbi:serine hydrolase domain-containing protein [Gemmatimonas sp.]|jgi:CubicO group peptidase (beta-lactamase class C family)|uniref:serine hydrolase domain-containing protein n=1 Tax=Gemmatimonas sp. TaxID=1962908 RepID=UPI0037C119AD
MTGFTPHPRPDAAPRPAWKVHHPVVRWATGLMAGLVLTACHRSPNATPLTPSAPLPAALRQTVLDSVRQVLDKAVADGAFPGAYAVIGTRRGIIAEYGAGRLDSADATRPTSRTVWDLASLTKVVNTTSAMLRLVGSGRVALDTPVVRYLPEWQVPGAGRVTVRHLLSHNAGLPAWRALYKEAATPEEAMALVLATPLDTVPGVRFVYSDLGFILLGRLVERVSGEPLVSYSPTHVFAPVGMRDTRFLPPASWKGRTAPTEQDPWRQRKVRGEVHDENGARLGGVAGHAGLFSTAHDLSRFARLYLNGGALDGVRVFDSTTVAAFTRVQDTTVSRRALGWETPTGRNSAGVRLTATAFGHTGFTGTSLWMDPERDLFVLLLTNRVNPTRQNLRIGAVRTGLADAVVGALVGMPR